MVLESQPMLSDVLTTSTGPWETIAWKVALDILLPIFSLWVLFKIISIAADYARINIDRRVAGDGDVVVELQQQSTLIGLVLLALQTPAMYMLPPWLFAYTLRTALNIIDLVVNKYKPKLPQLVDYAIKQVSRQLVPLDAALQTLLQISGVLFSVWFFVQLKDILIREIILVRAIRSGRKELERVLVPLSTLVTWAAVLACGISICGSLGVNLKPLLAVGGAGGLAAGFASQQLLLNLVSGINIFLTRPFVIGDQVVFAGGANIEGTVEGVEIMRTLLRTVDGTLVAVPNKVVADLVVFNRTRALSQDPVGSKAALAAAAPLRRVLCFTIELARELEPELDNVRRKVTSYLNTTTKRQLRDAGLINGVATSRNGSMSRQSISSVSSLSSKDSAQASVGEVKMGAAVAQVLERAEEAVSAAVAVITAAEPGINGDNEEEEKEEQDPSEALAVSITLSKMTENSISLFVRCELLLAATSMQNAIERQTETTLVGVSKLIREQYKGTLLY
eukprot:gene1461-1803_t